MKVKKNLKGFSFYAIILIVLLLVLFWTEQTKEPMKEDFGYNDLIEKIDQVQRIEVFQNTEIPTGKVTVYFKAAEVGEVPTKVFFVPSTALFEESMKQYEDVKVVTSDIQKPGVLWTILPWIVILGASVILFFFIFSQSQGGGANRAMAFGKSKAKMVIDDKKKVTFKNVAGLQEEKEELEEVVDFLKSPRKFVELGARIPKGVILVGPPGTGKTLLAKAVAGEAGVPFFSISGSDFVEMFVGVGASRVRDLFEQAKKNAPCIIFIDEIDAVGRRRGAGLGGGHDEREQTLNQLLVEMDGFGNNEGVIVLAATNRADILDPAILRPGRFDRRVYVGKPDVRGREEILKVHSKGKPLSDDINLKELAQTTAGFTGADLENLLNEAAIFAARTNSKVIKQEDLRRSFVKVGIGTEKRSRVISDKEKRITAFHEAGHAIVQHVLPDVDSVHSISIIPTGMAGGYTMSIPEKDEMYMTKKKMEQEIVILLSGRVSEKLVLDDITTGASNDIERATTIARNMVVRYGMSDVLGPIQFGEDDSQVFIGRDWGHTRNYGENVAGLIDSEIRRIVEDAYEKAMELLENNKEALHRVAEELLKREKITREQFEKAFRGEVIEDDVDVVEEKSKNVEEATTDATIIPESIEDKDPSKEDNPLK
ncbi:MAG: cell division protein FtsH [Firmicutes bacterium HGW-Firmicutes-1]|jgi:cell division protease FtsH|nr:MAG: cell division protein FtsH [Firmicutes bacterium HGW-Firmicutes-1]